MAIKVGTSGWSYPAGDVKQLGFRTKRRGIVDLGVLRGESYALAVNDSGPVVGASGREVTHAFSWTKQGGMVDLGTLGGTPSVAFAVNPGGQVVGSSYTAGDSARHATLWQTRRTP